MAISKNIYPYEQATGELWSLIVELEIQKRPLLNWLGAGRATRHRGPVRNIQGSNPLDQGFAAVSETARIDHDLIRNTDINTYVSEIRKMGQSFAEQLSAGFFASLNEIFDHPDSEALTIDLSKKRPIKNDQQSS